jgi:RNA polymerase sigma factor (sigma-70 family)
MSLSETSSWALVRVAASGDPDARRAFVDRYATVIRRYLARRWRNSPCRTYFDDAVQDVFVECLKPDGVLHKADPDRGGRFQSLLFAVVDNVARRYEQRYTAENARRAGGDVALESLPAQEDSSRDFYRVMAQEVVRDALRRLRERDGAAGRRLAELLSLRHYENLPIREIARLWGVAPEQLHRDQTRARKEFEDCLRQAVAVYCPGTPDQIEQAVAELVAMLL